MIDNIGNGGENRIEAPIRTALKDRLAVRLGIGLAIRAYKIENTIGQGSFSRSWEPLLSHLKKG